MNQKQVCQLDFDGYFMGVTVADESPLEPGVFLMPARTIDVAPPAIPEGKRAKWDGSWSFDDIPPAEPESTIKPEPITPEYEAAMRDDEKHYAYRREADPIFFKAQRGEATMEQWLAKVAEIKARYPKE